MKVKRWLMFCWYVKFTILSWEKGCLISKFFNWSFFKKEEKYGFLFFIFFCLLILLSINLNVVLTHFLSSLPKFTQHFSLSLIRQLLTSTCPYSHFWSPHPHTTQSPPQPPYPSTPSLQNISLLHPSYPCWHWQTWTTNTKKSSPQTWNSNPLSLFISTLHSNRSSTLRLHLHRPLIIKSMDATKPLRRWFFSPDLFTSFCEPNHFLSHSKNYIYQKGSKKDAPKWSFFCSFATFLADQKLKMAFCL